MCSEMDKGRQTGMSTIVYEACSANDVEKNLQQHEQLLQTSVRELHNELTVNLHAWLDAEAAAFGISHCDLMNPDGQHVPGFFRT